MRAMQVEENMITCSLKYLGCGCLGQTLGKQEVAEKAETNRCQFACLSNIRHVGGKDNLPMGLIQERGRVKFRQLQKHSPAKTT